MDLFHLLLDIKDTSTLIWIMNINAENEWDESTSRVIDRFGDRLINRIEEINLILCRSQDVLLLHKYPNADYLDYLKDMGFYVPTILTVEHNNNEIPIAPLILQDKKILKELYDLSAKNHNVFLVPYAVTPDIERISEICNIPVIGPSSDVAKTVNNKIINKNISRKLGFKVAQGYQCNNLQEVEEAYHELRKYFNKVVFKEPIGASGKGLRLVDDDDIGLSLNIIKRMHKNKPIEILVEGWYDKKFDLNCQISISDQGECSVFSVKKQLLHDTIYYGSDFPVDAPFIKEYEAHCYKAAQFLYTEYHYQGVIGIDSIYTADDVLIPIIEINGRFTLSTYSSFLEKKFRGKKIRTCYLNVYADQVIEWRSLLNILEECNIHYTNDKREGCIVYNSATLPNADSFLYDKYYGKIFLIILADDWDKVQNIYDIFRFGLQQNHIIMIDK